MLAPNEPVLDEQASVSSIDKRLAKNDALRDALQTCRAENERLRAQLALSEALTGMHIEALDDGTYMCGVYRDAKTSAAHWRHKHIGGEPTGPTRLVALLRECTGYRQHGNRVAGIWWA